jgi:hypothetical protein
MGAAPSSDLGCLVRCCNPGDSRGANGSLIEIAPPMRTRAVFDTVVRIDDPVDGVVRLLREADDLTQRCRLADFASRSPRAEPCGARCSQYRLCQDGDCQHRVGHCGISRVTDASGCPLAR